MENISKILVDESAGKKIGYILDVAIDFDNMKKIGYYVVDGETESEFLLELNDITKFSDEYVFVERASVLQFTLARNSVFGKLVLDEKGNSLGCVQALSFKGKNCDKFFTERCEIPAKFVSKVGEEVIFLHFGRKKKQKNEHKFTKSDNGVVVSIMEAKGTAKPQEIERVALSSDFYIGKISTQDIFGYNNEKIATKGQVITKNVVAKARQHNKMNQLFFAIKRDK